MTSPQCDKRNNTNFKKRIEDTDTRKKKRKRRIDAKDQLVKERQERYEKLLYQAKKGLHQQAKLARSFECAKVARKLKSKPDDTLREKLSIMKQFKLDMVVSIAIFRLGILNLNPNYSEATTVMKPENSEEEKFVEKLLSHKRMVSSLEEWNDKVTQFRRWFLKRQDTVHGMPQFGRDKSRNKKQKKAENAVNYFVTFGEDSQNNGTEGMPTEKKNRPGQRARRAKAMAIEARKNGKVLSKSINWREPKPKTDLSTKDESQDVKPKKVEAAKIAEMGKTWKEQGNAHPSWAARSSEKKGIVAFQGKKITFD